MSDEQVMVSVDFKEFEKHRAALASVFSLVSQRYPKASPTQWSAMSNSIIALGLYKITRSPIIHNPQTLEVVKP